MNDRIPPSDIDVERAVLSAMLKGSSISISADDFYLEAHRNIYKAMRKHGNDIVLLLRDTSVDAKYVNDAMETVVTTANIPEYVSIIKEFASKRRIMSLGGNLMNMGYNGSTPVEMAVMAKGILDVEFQSAQPDIDLPGEYLKRYEKIANGDIELNEFPVGIHSYTKRFGNFSRSHLHVIGADSKMGKTTLAFSMAASFFNAGKTGLIFEREKNRFKTIDKFYQGAKGRIPKYTKDSIGDMVQFLALIRDRWGMHIRDRWMSLDEMIAEVERINPDFIILDTIQSMVDGIGESNRPDLYFGTIARKFESFARDGDRLVILISQLGGDCASKQRRPRVGDLRESKQIREAADTIDLLYWERMYKEDAEFPNVMELNRAYNRDGAPATRLLLRFDPSKAYYGDLDAEERTRYNNYISGTRD